MNTTTVTFRTDKKVKQEANDLFESLGLNLSVAINMFLKQAVIEKKYPCSLDLNVTNGIKATYPKDFFEFFSKPSNSYGFDDEPKELNFTNDTREKI